MSDDATGPQAIRFLGLDFRPISVADVPVLEPLLRADPQPLSGFTPATLLAWNPHYHYAWAVLPEGTLLISCHFGDPSRRHLLQPVGPFPEAVRQRIVDEAARLPYALKFYGVSAPFLEKYPEFVSGFSVEDDRASANYVYRVTDLAQLPGRPFHQKRNLVVQASKLWNFTLEPVTAANVEECRRVLAGMDREDGTVLEGTLANERVALLFTLDHLEAIGERGLLMRIDGVPAAFTLYERLTPDSAVVHFEKARRQFKGIYQVLNQECARELEKQGFQLVNREEDLGNEGLRKAKLSYNPVELRSCLVLTRNTASA